MGFFATFWAWLNTQTADYIAASTTRLAGALEPAILVLGTLYVMAWGYLQISGRIEEPLGDGVRRIVLLGIVLAVSLHLWLYNSVIVDTVYRAPAELAAAVIGNSDPVRTIDAIWQRGGEAAGRLLSDATWTNGYLGFYLAGTAIWLCMGMLCVYTMFLIALSNVALAVLLALGPLFVALALFEGTRRYFQSWISQLINYALVTVLTVFVSALLLQIVDRYAQQTTAVGASMTVVDTLDMLLMSVLVFLFMRQILPVAAALAGGVGLSSMGFVSRAVAWGRLSAWTAARQMPLWHDKKT